MSDPPRVFQLSGTVTNLRGDPLRRVVVAVVDEDLIRDDLIGVGITGPSGVFRASFVESEFNQDWFELERHPDIYLIFSIWTADGLVVVGRRYFPDLDFTAGAVDLGEVKVPRWGPEPIIMEGVEATPGISRRVKRLNLSNDLVAHCLDDVVGKVERLTGWPDLLEGVEARVVKDMRPWLRRMVERLGGERDPLFERVFGAQLSRMFFALYDPDENLILVNDATTRYCNLDGLKVLLGHELVHVGQFKHTPGLLDAYHQQFNAIFSVLDEEAGAAENAASFRAAGIQGFMANLEGYAHYIQRDYLERYYNCRMLLRHVSFFDRAVAYLVQRFFSEGMDQEFEDLKKEQYLEGAERFRDSEGGEAPATFSPGD